MKLKLLLFSTLLINFSACSDAETLPQQGGGEKEEPDTPSASVEKTVTINAGQTFQTIKGFAASDCWTPAFVGKYWTNNRASDSRCGVSTWEEEAWNKETTAAFQTFHAVPNPT